MRYENIQKAKFLERPNRFVAYVELSGATEKCHVKNTGRCRELLIPGSTIYIEKSSNPDRKTKYDLIGVLKGNTLINMDSQMPNYVVREWLEKGNLFKEITLLKPETKYGTSRFDFYLEADGKRVFIEVKGVTLEESGIARFPDAPTERGVKHIQELEASLREGYEAYIIFVIQMKGITRLEPNDRTHRAFGDELRKARSSGVHVLAYDCVVTENTIVMDAPVKVDLLEYV